MVQVVAEAMERSNRAIKGTFSAITHKRSTWHESTSQLETTDVLSLSQLDTMGAAQSSSAFCCGHADGSSDQLLPGSRRGGVQPQSVARSRPQAIKVQTPAYSEGGFENKYELTGQIGAFRI